MTELVHANCSEVRGVLQPGEYFSLRKKRAQIQDSLVSISEHQFEHTVDNRLGQFNARKFFHSIGPIFSCDVACTNALRSLACLDEAH